MKKLINSKQVNTRLPIHMVHQIKYVAKERGMPEGSIIEAALRDYLGKTEKEDILLKKSDRLSRQMTKMQRENKMMLDMMTSFIRVYLTHTEEIPQSNKHQAEAKGITRFKRFMELVAKTMEEGKPFVDELENKQFSEEDFVQ